MRPYKVLEGMVDELASIGAKAGVDPSWLLSWRDKGRSYLRKASDNAEGEAEVTFVSSVAISELFKQILIAAVEKSANEQE